MHGGLVTRRRFLAAVGGLSAASAVPSLGRSSARAAAVARRHEYVFLDGRIAVHDTDAQVALVDTIELDTKVTRIRGACCSPVTQQLYVSYAGADTTDHVWLMRYDLHARQVRWVRTFSSASVDTVDVSPNGRRLYLSTGTTPGYKSCRVLNAFTGATVTNVVIAARPHNVVVGLTGGAVYVGTTGEPYISVVDRSSNQGVKRIGPFGTDGPSGGGGVRPFTVNGRQTRASVNVNAGCWRAG